MNHLRHLRCMNRAKRLIAGADSVCECVQVSETPGYVQEPGVSKSQRTEDTRWNLSRFYQPQQLNKTCVRHCTLNATSQNSIFFLLRVRVHYPTGNGPRMIRQGTGISNVHRHS